MSGSASIACILPLTLSSMRLATSSSLIPGHMPGMSFVLPDNALRRHGSQGHAGGLHDRRATPATGPTGGILFGLAAGDSDGLVADGNIEVRQEAHSEQPVDAVSVGRLGVRLHHDRHV